MAAWRKICCPVDFSGVSPTAMEDAADLAWRFLGELTIVHVDTHARSGEEPSPRDPATMEFERMLAAWRREAESMVGRWVDAYSALGRAH